MATSPLRQRWICDDAEFSGIVATLGAAAGLIAVWEATNNWSRVLLAVAAAAVAVRGFWRSMPPLLLIVATVPPVAVTEAYGWADMGWFVVCVAMLFVASNPMSALSWVGVAATIATPLGLYLGGVPDYVEHKPWIWMFGIALSAAMGRILGQQRELIAELEAQQAQLATAAVNDERRRIARELHDVVGHSFSVVLLHLTGARGLVHSDPDRAEAALADAEEFGRTSMNDLRAALHLLGSDDDPTTPVHGVDQLPDLVASLRDAGMDVQIDGQAPAGLDRAASVVLYGVAREALTNAARHGADGAVEVTLEVGDRAELVVVNPTKTNAPPPSSASLGLEGIRQRVRAIGGEVFIGGDGGRWMVRASVPVS